MPFESLISEIHRRIGEAQKSIRKLQELHIALKQMRTVTLSNRRYRIKSIKPSGTRIKIIYEIEK